MAERHDAVSSRKKRKLSPRGLYTIVEWLQFKNWAPLMGYDRPQTDAQVETIQKQLAPHNLMATVGKNYILVQPLNWDGQIALHWLSIADEIVFENGGGCQA